MVKSCSAPTATGSRQGEMRLLQSPQPEVSPETQHQEQWKPDLEDEQQWTSAGRSPFKSKSSQCEFGELLSGQKESLGVSPLHQGAHLGWGVKCESGMHIIFAKYDSKRQSMSQKERKMRKGVMLKGSPKGSKLLFFVGGMKGYCSYMTRIAFFTFSFSITAAKFSQDSMFMLTKINFSLLLKNYVQ